MKASVAGRYVYLRFKCTSGELVPHRFVSVDCRQTGLGGVLEGRVEGSKGRGQGLVILTWMRRFFKQIDSRVVSVGGFVLAGSAVEAWACFCDSGAPRVNEKWISAEDPMARTTAHVIPRRPFHDHDSSPCRWSRFIQCLCVDY